jgi:hypothetical protein
MVAQITIEISTRSCTFIVGCSLFSSSPFSLVFWRETAFRGFEPDKAQA